MANQNKAGHYFIRKVIKVISTFVHALSFDPLFIIIALLNSRSLSVYYMTRLVENIIRPAVLIDMAGGMEGLVVEE